MKTGRNDRCPCGSGKKYKVCCLRRDQASQIERERLAQAQQSETQAKAEQQELANRAEAKLRAAATTKNRVEPPLDPHMDALIARWDEFQKQDFAGQISLFLETLNDATLMDDEMAFEMLVSIHGHAVQWGVREKYVELVSMLRERHPDVYASSRHYYLHFQIIDAIVEGRAQEVNKLARELAETAEKDADTFFQAVKCLAYHGGLAALVDALGIAWPIVEGSTKLLDPAEVARWGADCTVFDYLERYPQIDGRDTELAARVKYFFPELDANPFADYVDRISGRITHDWTQNDFVLQPSGGRKQREKITKSAGRTNLRHLATEFVGYLRREMDIPFTKGHLAAKNITNYIVQRLDGELDKSPGDFAGGLCAPRERKQRPARTAPLQPLCPDHRTLDRFLGNKLHFLSPQSYDVASTFELFPLWLTFLERRGLIDTDHRAASLDELQELRNRLRQLWDTNHDDPTLASNLQNWPDIHAPSLVKP